MFALPTRSAASWSWLLGILLIIPLLLRLHADDPGPTHAQGECATPTPVGGATTGTQASATAGAAVTAVASAAATGITARGTAAILTATALARGTRAPITPVIVTAEATARAAASATARAGAGPPGAAPPVCTPTPARSRTPERPGTPTRDVTATPAARYAAYLPMAARRLEGRCPPRKEAIDLVLVLDMSTSMHRESDRGRPKHVAASEAAIQLIESMDLPRDRAAVVGFNDRAWTAQPLTGDRVALLRAVAELASGMAEGTRLDRALRQGGKALDQGASAGGERSKVLLLLTDGLPNRVPTPVSGGSQEDAVVLIAEALREDGVTIYSVGLGAPGDLLPNLLERIAGSPTRSFIAPDAEDLEAVYRQIAGRLRGCP